MADAGNAGARDDATAGTAAARISPAARLGESFASIGRTAVCLLVLPAAFALASMWVILLVLVRASPRRVDRAYTGLARLCLAVAGTRIAVHGLQHLQAGQAYVVVPNHESDWDPVVLVASLASLRLRAVIKERMARIAVLGRALLLTGNVRVQRTDTAADVQRIREAMASRPRDVSMLFYAEGTRSRDGALHAFKKGAFVTAIAHGLPVLPVATAGTRRIWPPLTLRIRSGPVAVEIGPPIPVAGLGLDDRDVLRDRSHAAVRELRAEARRRLRALGVEPGGID